MLWRLGVLVLSTILVAATLILYLGPGFQRTYQLTILCDTAPGVTPETPIHRNGILIGRVDSVKSYSTKDERINGHLELVGSCQSASGDTSVFAGLAQQCR